MPLYSTKTAQLKARIKELEEQLNRQSQVIIKQQKIIHELSARAIPEHK